jgi:hypothetical protein
MAENSEWMELEDVQANAPKQMTKDIEQRMNAVRGLRKVGRLSNKMSTDTVAELIQEIISEETKQGSEYDTEARKITVMNYADDVVKPSHVVDALDLENWTGVAKVGRKTYDSIEDADEIVIKLW